MKTEEIIFTEEMLTLLYNRAFEYLNAKYGADEYEIHLGEGHLSGVTEDIDGGKEYYGVDLNQLNNLDYDTLVAERLEKQRIQKEKYAEEMRIRQERARISKEKEDYRKFLELKIKFESK